MSEHLNKQPERNHQKEIDSGGTRFSVEDLALLYQIAKASSMLSLPVRGAWIAEHLGYKEMIFNEEINRIRKRYRIWLKERHPDWSRDQLNGWLIVAHLINHPDQSTGEQKKAWGLFERFTQWVGAQQPELDQSEKRERAYHAVTLNGFWEALQRWDEQPAHPNLWMEVYPHIHDEIERRHARISRHLEEKNKLSLQQQRRSPR